MSKLTALRIGHWAIAAAVTMSLLAACEDETPPPQIPRPASAALLKIPSRTLVTCEPDDGDVGGCMGIPGVLGHAELLSNATFPEGCLAILPYENPNAKGAPIQCDCQRTTWLGRSEWSCGK